MCISSKCKRPNKTYFEESVYIFAHVYIHIHLHVNLSIYTYTYIYICICIYIYMYICIYIYIYIYIHYFFFKIPENLQSVYVFQGESILLRPQFACVRVCVRVWWALC